MARKSEEIPIDSLAAFSEAFTNLAEGLRATTDMATKSGQPISSTNWPTALRGLDYINKFVNGLAAQAATSNSRSKIDELLELQRILKEKEKAEASGDVANLENQVKKGRTGRKKDK